MRDHHQNSQNSQKCLHITIQGVVQGVGFRPFIYRIATDLKLNGWVKNSPTGVSIEVEGKAEQLAIFLQRIQIEKPPLAIIHQIKSQFIKLSHYSQFIIDNSSHTGEKTTLILPDAATCSDCLSDIFTATNRRYFYPFTNCTNCGPRFSIIESLPYDRPYTTMKDFVMCNDCQTEYLNPSSRRFHAQPNACPNCGPQLELWNHQGEILGKKNQALLLTVEAIYQGKIIAVKGLGGFHFVVDARNKSAVQKLRDRKQRPTKALALMYPNLEQIKQDCHVSISAEKILTSTAAPIVLLKPKKSTSTNIANNIAANHPYLGIMLPYTPLYHLLMEKLGFPIVATSGNISDEPICTCENTAIQSLGHIADLFLVNNRPIHQPIDDSIVQIIAERPLILRRARGYAPLPIPINSHFIQQYPHPKILAVGGYLKNTTAIFTNQQAFISQHLGNIQSSQNYDIFQQTITVMMQTYEFKPDIITCDLHPNYLTSQYAKEFSQKHSIPLITVQHHYAHSLACIAENNITGSVLSIAWDGTGFGTDNTIWGGEFLLINDTSYRRFAHLRTFALPGGEKAIKQPKRSALGLLYELFADELFGMGELSLMSNFSTSELATLQTMLQHQFNTPITSSCGRLFDAVSSILGLQAEISFEGEAAIALEYTALEYTINNQETDTSYKFDIIDPSNPQQPLIVDWSTMVKQILAEIETGLPISLLSAKFHNTLAEIIVAIAIRSGETKVVLTGGCFQNKYLLERTINRLRAENFTPYWHKYIPCNDGGIALGQIMAALRVTNPLA